MRNALVALSLLLVATAALGQDDGPARLEPLAGKWAGYSSWGTGVRDSVNMTTGWMKADADRTAPEVVSIRGDRWGVRAGIAWNPGTSSYLVGWTAESCPAVAGLKVQPSADGGFVGAGSVACGESKCEVSASIAPDGDGWEWLLVAKQGDNICRLRLSLLRPE